MIPANSGPAELDAELARLLGDAAALAPAAAVQYAVRGELSDVVTAGSLQTVDAAGAHIPAGDRDPVPPESLFDLASVTKVVSAMTLLTLVDDGLVDLDEPIGAYLDQFAGGDKMAVTLRHLLTHTSGLPATWSGWQGVLGTRFSPADFTAGTARRELLADLLATPLAHRPGTYWEYSCVGFITAMAAAEQAANAPWPLLVRSRVLEPLELSGITFSPDPARTAATELQPDAGRGVVRGIVHDETAWSLGGACANAGLFAAVTDVVRLGEVIRVPGEGRVGRAATRMWPEEVPATFRPADGPGQDLAHGHTLGLRIGQTEWMTDAGARARGHSGFTGTSLHVDREKGLTVAILTNRVHPLRTTADPASGIHALRRAITSAIYERT
ncbi:serine hydrolase domain-containing protein [Spelaeicoccus albus]|uniref:CubicO group peptidase (Beta-lactamase class C family) n=1 Tax=Spelaeicoccus albus TaxID=1280376 RepID=A0A7Z0ABS4_9MICO|nr:serine hydrolase domain-containing protein [Spelaeicoccus albus]NYI67293.1 CubicO group peptidase (beta-lactamase class C family) [Spelaeicoccus albus]